MTEDEEREFDIASNHPYECTCDLCKKWWRAMGPEMEDDEMEDGYGPFGDEKP